MWAATIRYYKGTFYIAFVANDTHKTYLYTATDIEGPWEKHEIEGFYHDCSLLFDEIDGELRVYIVYGNRYIWLTELRTDLSGPKEGGVHRMIVSDEGNPRLGYEGSHLYKINGRYYLFLIHSRRDRWMRNEACFSADSLEGEFVGGDVFEETLDYCDMGVAQGGIVDTPDGKWYSLLFQDRDAGGRMPVLVPVTWEGDTPVFGDHGKMPDSFEVESTRPGYEYAPLVKSDDFRGEIHKGGVVGEHWEFNHEPWTDLCEQDSEKGCYRITMGKLCKNVVEAPNTITQRMRFPECEASVLVDGSDLKEGDYAGMVALCSCYGAAAVTKRDGQYYAVLVCRDSDDDSFDRIPEDHEPGDEVFCAPLSGPRVRFKIAADFWEMRDVAVISYEEDGEWKVMSDSKRIFFRRDHFTGVRYGLFGFATGELGGSAEFYDFRYE